MFSSLSVNGDFVERDFEFTNITIKEMHIQKPICGCMYTLTHTYRRVCMPVFMYVCMCLWVQNYWDWSSIFQESGWKLNILQNSPLRMWHTYSIDWSTETKLFFFFFFFFFFLLLLLLLLLFMRVFHISVSWWSFTGDYVTASLLKSVGLFSVFWPFSIMLLFGWSPLGYQLPNLLCPLIIL